MRNVPRSHVAKARAALATVLAATLGFAPLTASSAASPADAAAMIETAVPGDFSASFAPIAAAPLPGPAMPADAVDLATIEPTPAPAASPIGRGSASYYASEFHGRRTANGERFNMHDMTAAHRNLPFGSRVRVTNPANGRSVVVRINDRGPFARGRMIDVSRAAAEQLGLIARGHATVDLELVSS